jgi:magnesium transporter
MEERIRTLLEEKNYKVLKIELSEMNNSDLAEILEEFEPSELVTLFRLMKKDDQVEVFALFDSNFSSELLNYFTDKEKVSLIEEMATDDAVDVLEEMPANIVDKLLKKCDVETRKDVNKLLNYKEDSAGSLMTVEYAEIKGSATVKQAIDYLRKEQDELETINYLFVVDDKRKLNGIVHLKDLVFASSKNKIKNIMEEVEVYAITSMDQEEVAALFQKYDINIMPVVDSEKRLVGIITIDDVVDVLEEEATEDMKKMAAIIPVDKPYDKTSVFETFKARIPWLLLLMVSATFTGAIITGFESKLASMTILTAFIPMLMDTGGNAGGQSSVSIIRALSLNQIEFKDIFKVVFKEFRVSILCAIVLGLCNFVKLLLLDRVGVMVALAVCITLCITVVIAKFIGTVLPILAKKIGFDPAVMASPFITTIVDACSLLVYFKVASIILGL